MPPKSPPPRSAPDVLPDSLPGRPDSDILPDDLRRTDQPDTPPDSLPRVDDAPPSSRAVGDGGVAQHPVHDEDQEDRGPGDYEAEIDAVERNTLMEHPEGSAPPLDRFTQDDKPETEER